jgi:hypothetical protein
MPNNSSKPIVSFIEYFKDVKPYHVKILEVIERYSFSESVIVNLSEGVGTFVGIHNDPYCSPVGFGVDFDEECGFDALDCCDDERYSISNAGLVYNNDDLLVTATITDVDETTDEVRVSGDHSYDFRLPIKSIPLTNKLLVEGDYTTYFNTHTIFLVIPYHTYSILDSTQTSFTIAGNRVTEFTSGKLFTVMGAGENSGKFTVEAAVYSLSLDQTEIFISPETVLTEDLALGLISIKATTKNNGAYQVDTAVFNGTDTVVTLAATKSFGYTDSDTINWGTVLFRTGLIPLRDVWIESTGTELDTIEYRILTSKYDRDNDETVIVLGTDLLVPAASGELQMYGYDFGPGWTVEDEPAIPPQNLIAVATSERLQIVVTVA